MSASARDRAGSGGGAGAGVAALGAILLLALAISAAHWAVEHWYVVIPALAAAACIAHLGLRAHANR